MPVKLTACHAKAAIVRTRHRIETVGMHKH